MNTPKIRFKGFSDDWEQRKLLELLTQPISDGPHETPDLVDAGVPFISVDAIIDNKINFEKKRGYITEEYDLECRKKYSPQRDDVYLVKSGSTVGKVAIVETDERFNIWSPLAAMRANKEVLLPKYLYYFFQLDDIQEEVSIKSKGGTQPNLSMRILEKFLIRLPNVEEQEMISDSLRNLDNLITLHQRKCDSLKQVKKYMLQKMFPKQGEKVPEIRFAGFTGDWEQRKVIDLLELLTDYDANGSFADMAENVHTSDGEGFAWYVRTTDLENPKPLSELKYVDESSYRFLKKTELHGGELLMAKRGDIGKVYIFEPRTQYATVAPNMYLLKLNKSVYPYFLHYFFISSAGNKKLTRLNASSTLGALYKEDVKNIDVIIPSIEEQTKIGNYLKDLDNLITLHQSKSDSLKQVKKYMLQNMFPQK